ncbi:MAG: bifunctional phosphoribosylaminoimidazolecarboxamide formyltransferase/IMP cyclohydrolase [Gammaproteobacteria bacterium]
MTSSLKIQRALMSVSDKTGVVDLAHLLTHQGIAIISTGGTAKLLKTANIPIEEVSDYTGFPEIMGGRVKTLHPKVHGGILGRSEIDEGVMQQHNIPPIDLVIVNLYPFAETIATGCSLSEAVEQVDIGGPTLLRGAAKNFDRVLTVVDPKDYGELIQLITDNDNTLEIRFQYAKKVFAHTAQYEATICNYFNGINLASHQATFPEVLTLQLRKQSDLRYGENPHQKAALYLGDSAPSTSLAQATLQQGKALSYNNLADTQAALECVRVFDRPACVIVKHANPCGVAVAETQLQAYQRAFLTDATSAFGGIIAFNQPLEADTAQAILNQQFVEVLIAPVITKAALTILADKPNIRVLETGAWSNAAPSGFDFKTIEGGLLIQEADTQLAELDQLVTVTERQPTDAELQDLRFAWKVAKFVKSNAIVYAKDQATVGIGAGQMSRVFSAILAGLKAEQAQLAVAGAVMASDAFFPFRDGIDAAAKAGITAIIQPGGSIRDAEVVAAANEANIAMLFTGIRHFKH